MDARHFAAFLLWFMVLLADATFAGTRDPDTPDHKYVEFGKQFPFVRRIRVNDEAAAKKGRGRLLVRL